MSNNIEKYKDVVFFWRVTYVALAILMGVLSVAVVLYVKFENSHVWFTAPIIFAVVAMGIVFTVFSALALFRWKINQHKFNF